MSENLSGSEIFYCRQGKKRIGPLNRRELRSRLAAGLIDAQTLISVNDERKMLPLGASVAADEIINVVKTWRRQFSLLVYFVWLIFLPLFSSGVAGCGLHMSVGNIWNFLIAVMLSLSGISYWLYRTWRMLLAEQHPLKALFYAVPMMIPFLNCIWIWIGYMKLPVYWRKYKHQLNISDETPYKLYYLVMLLFYLINVSFILMFFVKQIDRLLIIQIIGSVSWMWFGLTLMSLFVTDSFTTKVIQKKLSNLAFGSLRFGADINYNILHKAVLVLAASARRSTMVLGSICLVISWLAGGWFWMTALEVYYVDIYENGSGKIKSCIFCENNTNN